LYHLWAFIRHTGFQIRRVYSSLDSHIRRRPRRILCISSCINFLPSKIHTRVPKNFQFRPSHISTETRLLPWDERSRDMGSVKGPPLCVSGGARLSMCALCSVRGWSDAVGHLVVPVAMSRTTGCCNPAAKADICGSDSLPNLDLASRSRSPGTEALISCKYEGPPVHRVAQWLQIGLKIMAICFEIRGDDRVGPDCRFPCQSASLFYATPFVCATPQSITHSGHPYLTIHPEEEQRKVCAQLSVSTVAFLSSFVFLRLEPAIISLAIGGHTQWLS